MKIWGFGLFADSFCKIVFPAWVEKVLAELQTCAKKIRYPLNFSSLLPILTQMNEKIRFWLVWKSVSYCREDLAHFILWQNFEKEMEYGLDIRYFLQILT